ncbi:MAG TPA: hypothetical protein DDY91_22665 [Planctomycetaceae bacterium]|nr:hypothetical protein [Planctomycetaceae bacterium]
MKCDRCPKVATFHITDIEKGEPTELHLCEDCAQKHTALAAPVSAGTAEEAGLSEVELEHLERLVCPTCKLGFRDFRSQGRLGCSDCYTAFREELLPLLENIHGDIQHVGKAPCRAPLDSRRRQDLIRLRSELKTAISEESYERAAELRDQIQQLERDLQGEGRP